MKTTTTILTTTASIHQHSTLTTQSLFSLATTMSKTTQVKSTQQIQTTPIVSSPSKPDKTSNTQTTGGPRHSASAVVSGNNQWNGESPLQIQLTTDAVETTERLTTDAAETTQQSTQFEQTTDARTSEVLIGFQSTPDDPDTTEYTEIYTVSPTWTTADSTSELFPSSLLVSTETLLSTSFETSDIDTSALEGNPEMTTVPDSSLPPTTTSVAWSSLPPTTTTTSVAWTGTAAVQQLTNTPWQPFGKFD